MKSLPLRVLALDIEGGFGGSSRSLYESLRQMDRARIAPEVWCRRAGPVRRLYEAIEVPCRVTPDLPKVSSLPRLSRNLYVYAKAFAEFARARALRAQLLDAVGSRFDLVHFNHEALFLLARWLHPRTRAPLTMHIRTRLADNVFSRWQIREISGSTDHLVFITENERDNFTRLGGTVPGDVIFNIATPPAAMTPHPAVPADGRLKIASLSNFAWVRGTDRLAGVARALAELGRRDILFVVAGDMRIPRSAPGALGRVARWGGTLAEYVVEQGLADMFLFLGHVAEPERVLAACDVLVKPTREDNPWGRDIIEAMAAGKPVLTVGRWDKFVSDGETGVLQREFDAAALARDIARLADDRQALAAMGAAARERVGRLCNGPQRARELLAVWEDVVRRDTRH